MTSFSTIISLFYIFFNIVLLYLVVYYRDMYLFTQKCKMELVDFLNKDFEKLKKCETRINELKKIIREQEERILELECDNAISKLDSQFLDIFVFGNKDKSKEQFEIEQHYR